MTSPRPVCGAFGSRVCSRASMWYVVLHQTQMCVCWVAQGVTASKVSASPRSRTWCRGITPSRSTTIRCAAVSRTPVTPGHYKAYNAVIHVVLSRPSACSLALPSVSRFAKPALWRDRQAWLIAGSQLSLCDISH